MSYIFLLDGIEFDPPINDQDLVTTIKRGANLDGFLVTQDAEFTFIGDAYVYLSDKFYNDGYCSEVEVEILEECDGYVTEIYTGIIKMSSIKIDEDLCAIKTKVQDNSFYSYINNNKGMDVSPTQNGTKTGVQVSPPTVWRLNVYDPATGTYSADKRSAFRVYDLLSHAITVMTDGKVGFTSDFLWNQDEELFLTTGNALAVTNNDPSFYYSFEKLYTELNKLFNLSFFIEQDDYSLPTIRIEQKDYFYQTSDGITFEDLKDLKVSVDQAKIYGTVMLGSKVINDAPAYLNFNEALPFYGFKEEKFYPIGQCNLDTELNLVNDYVLSSNVIEDCVMGSSETYYDNLIFVSCGNLDIALQTADAIQYELNNISPPYIYNLNLNNYNKAQRHYGYLPANLLDAFNINTSNFRAETQTLLSYFVGSNSSFGSGTQIPFYQQIGGDYWFRLIQTQFPFPDDYTAGNYDLGSNYNNATYRYTVPADGQYTFSCSLFVDLANTFLVDENHSYIIVWIKQYDSANNFKDLTFNQVFFPATASAFEASASSVFECLATDYVEVEIHHYVRTFQPPITNMIQYSIRGTSFFMSNSDNLIVTGSDLSYKIIQYEFQLPVSKADFNTLLADPTGLQTFTKWSEALQLFRSRRAWLEEIKYNNHTGLANIKLIANNAIIQE